MQESQSGEILQGLSLQGSSLRREGFGQNGRKQ